MDAMPYLIQPWQRSNVGSPSACERESRHNADTDRQSSAHTEVTVLLLLTVAVVMEVGIGSIAARVEVDVRNAAHRRVVLAEHLQWRGDP